MSDAQHESDRTARDPVISEDHLADDVSAPRVSSILGPLPVGSSVQRVRSLNDAVHQILIVGLALSTVLLVFGVALQAIRGVAMPSASLPPLEGWQSALHGQPAGLLSLGLIVLMLTPVARVIGSVVVFLWERDWNYAAITTLVLLVMLTSVLLGNG